MTNNQNTVGDQAIFQVKLSGKIRSFNFGDRFWDHFCQMMKVTRADVHKLFEGASSTEAVGTLIYCAITTADEIHHRPKSITLGEAYTMANSPQNLTEITTVLCMMAEYCIHLVGDEQRMN
jgi:hypothetical protein